MMKKNKHILSTPEFHGKSLARSAFKYSSLCLTGSSANSNASHINFNNKSKLTPDKCRRFLKISDPLRSFVFFILLLPLPLPLLLLLLLLLLFFEFLTLSLVLSFLRASIFPTSILSSVQISDSVDSTKFDLINEDFQSFNRN